jgi:hypothetical protein
VPRSLNVITLALAVAALAACANAPEQPAAAPTTPAAATPSALPLPNPQTAKLGQPIRVAEYDQDKEAAKDPEPWSTASITVTAVKTSASDPAIPQRFLAKGKLWVAITLSTTAHTGKFVLYSQHFKLVAPDGTTYPEDPNGAYRKDAFRPLASSADEQSTPPPGSGTILYLVPTPGLPTGTHLQGEVVAGHPFTWNLS